MPFTPRSRFKPSTLGSKGLFQDGEWFCDCDPRLPAVYLETKKRGPNKGRWFFTCPKGRKGGQCGFFQWEDLARKEGLMPNNATAEQPVAPAAAPARTEPVSPSPAPRLPKRQKIFRGAPVPERDSSTDDDDMFVADHPDRSSWSQPSSSATVGRFREAAPSPASASASASRQPPGSSSSNSKRKRAEELEPEPEDFHLGELDSETERALAAAADMTPSQHGTRRSTQRAAKIVPPSTPTARRIAGPGGATPVSRNRLLTVAEGREREREAKRVRFLAEDDLDDDNEDGDDEAPPDLPPPLASSPSKPASSPSPSGPRPPASTDKDIAVILALLPPGVPLSTRTAVRRELKDFALRVAGEATARVAELQARVVSLEEERSMERERTKKMKAMLAEMLMRDG